jgi:hypothetical protein
MRAGFEQGALDGGGVNSVGTHEELLASDPLYREPAENQLANITAPEPRCVGNSKRSAPGGSAPVVQERAYRFAASLSFAAIQTAGSSASSASPCSSSQRSASMAARQPSPAAVTAWR